MPHSIPEFVPYDKFMRDLETVQPEDYLGLIKNSLSQTAAGRAGALGPTVLRARASAEFTKMHEYLHNRYRASRSVHTFLNSAGHHIDCIPMGQLPAVLAARQAGYKVTLRHKAPMPPKELVQALQNKQFKPLRSMFRPGDKDAYGNERICPEGCAPVRRLTISRMARLGTFENFFRKAPLPPRTVPAVAAPLGASAGDGHKYAICITGSEPCTGILAALNIWNPDPNPGIFSLSQTWIKRSWSGMSDTPPKLPQTVESGWTVDPNRTGVFGPTLFVFVNPDGYGDLSGYGKGFIQAEQSPLIVDAAVEPISGFGGDQYWLILQWQLDDNGDWVLFTVGDSVGDPMKEIGSIPGAVYNVLAQGDWDLGADFGGEVAPGQGGATGQMGNKNRPTNPFEKNAAQVAAQKTILFRGTNGDSYSKPDLTHRTDVPGGDMYDLVVGEGSDSGADFYFGGPDVF